MKWLVLLATLCATARAGEDPYLRYIREAPEFKEVRRVEGRWETWTYMPWRYRWTIGTGEEGGRFCREYGINGGFTDHGRGPVGWLEKWNLRFYNDHTAGKGTLYLRGANEKRNFRSCQRDGRAVRPVPLDAKTLEATRALVRRNLRDVSRSPMRLAYALDDEISWSAFVVPIPWRVHQDDQDYERWLERYYGEPRKAHYLTPDFTRKQLDRSLKEIDFSPFLDRMTYNDSVFANFLQGLVETANEIDPTTPCGFVGGQGPSLWGGYDYAKLCRKAQFLEIYDVGSAPEIARSLAPHVPLVSTHFHKEGTRDSWLAWSRFAHGQQGMIGWVDGWFDGKTPRTWLRDFAPTLKELSRVQGPKMRGASWLHDGVAIYYSHPSVQVSWCLDSEPHRSTWPNRGNDHRLGTTHLVRKAWERMLNDAGLQYDFLDYAFVARHGVPEGYGVLILPACFALSDIEAERIRDFARRGGRVVADFMCGLFDQHGKGRTRGALDDLFGVEHDGSESARDFFGQRLWVETDQDKAYSYERPEELFSSLEVPTREGFAIPERRLRAPSAPGHATYLNLSPQRYLMHRENGHVFTAPCGVRPWVRAPGAEVTYWRKGDRILLFVLRPGRAEIELRFSTPVTNVVDERKGAKLGDGDRFRLTFEDAAFLSLTRP